MKCENSNTETSHMGVRYIIPNTSTASLTQLVDAMAPHSKC